MDKNDNNVIEFRLPNNPRRNKVRELRILLKEKERRRLERERLEAMRKHWTPKVKWSTVVLLGLSLGSLLSVIFLSVYAALN